MERRKDQSLSADALDASSQGESSLRGLFPCRPLLEHLDPKANFPYREAPTILRWPRKRFVSCRIRLFRKIRLGRQGRDRQKRQLLSRIACSNPLWAAPRVHGELWKPGIDTSERTVPRSMPERRKSSLSPPVIADRLPGKRRGPNGPPQVRAGSRRLSLVHSWDLASGHNSLFGPGPRLRDGF